MAGAAVVADGHHLGCCEEVAEEGAVNLHMTVEILEGVDEVSGILELGNVWVFVQLIHRPMRTKNQLYKNPNIARLQDS